MGAAKPPTASHLRVMMSFLAQYNPLKAIWLPGAELAAPHGVIVLVGPNSSGKSLFLRDIETSLLSGTNKLVVCQGIAQQRPNNFQDFVNELVANDYVREVPGHDGTYRAYVPFLSPKGPGNEQYESKSFTFKSLAEAFEQFNDEPGGKNPKWFGACGALLIAPLSLDQRRTICNKSDSFNHKTQAPTRPLHGLLVNSPANARLAEETGNVFGNAVWLDSSEQQILQLRVSDEKHLPPSSEMTNPLQASKYTEIENEGDGYRSYVGICLSLLLATRPVALIDEPELCLHPPQAYHIGRFIGSYAPDGHVTFVATHSSHVLRGILEAGKKVTVIRLTRQKRTFTGHLVDEQQLVDTAQIAH